MKKIPMFFLAIWLCQNIFAQNPGDLSSEITEVTVFLRGAQITREATVTVEGGQNILMFRGLESGINPQNIQVSAPEEAVINSVVHQVNYLKNADKSPRIRKMEDSLNILRELVENETDRQSVLGQEKQMILANQQLAGKEKGVATEELERAANFYRNRLTDIEDRLYKSRKVKEKHQKDQQRITQQLTEWNYEKNQPSNDIQVIINSFSRRKVSIQLRYMVENAGWVPGYDLRAADVESPIRIDYKADVFQNTGVDWKQVRLTLSSGNPNQGGSKPELNPWFVSLYTEDYGATGGAILYEDAPTMSAEPMVADDEVSKEEDEEAQKNVDDDFRTQLRTTRTLANYTYVKEGATTAEFLISILQDIPSDGQAHKVSVQSQELPSDFLHMAVPKLDRDAFLLARVTGWEALNLLPGKANIFFEGTYVAESSIDPNYTNDTLEFSLGRDKKIVIQREQLKDFNKTRTIGTNRERTFGYEITVRNNKSQAVKLKLQDQLPISQDEDITVKPLEISGATHNPDTGQLIWDLNLKPSESITLRLVFMVKYPKNKSISGF